MSYTLLSLPFIAAAIGWLTNYMAIKMLFHPKEKVKVLMFEIQGIFPKRQDVLASKLAKVVAEELISFDDIKGRLGNTNNLASIKVVIDRKLDEYLNDKLPDRHPIIAMFMRQKTKDELKNEFIREIDGMIPLLINKYMDNLEKNLDLEAIVEEKVSKFSTDKLEDILNSILQQELRFIEIVGAVLGFFVGLVQLLIIQLPGVM